MSPNPAKRRADLRTTIVKPDPIPIPKGTGRGRARVPRARPTITIMPIRRRWRGSANCWRALPLIDVGLKKKKLLKEEPPIPKVFEGGQILQRLERPPKPNNANYHHHPSNRNGSSACALWMSALADVFRRKRNLDAG